MVRRALFASGQDPERSPEAFARFGDEEDEQDQDNEYNRDDFVRDDPEGGGSREDLDSRDVYGHDRRVAAKHEVTLQGRT